MKKNILIYMLIVMSFILLAQEPDWQWSTQAGGSNNDKGMSITTDASGNCYVTGLFFETATFGSYTLTSGGALDIFVAKMDPNGNWLWATKAGGSDHDYGNEITTDAAGNCYVTGRFMDTATFGSYYLTSNGSCDIFVAKMDALGNWLWATKAGGTSGDYGHAISIDDSGNSYVTGYFYGTTTFGPYPLTSSGSCDIFVAKIDAQGNWQWVIQAGGGFEDLGYGLVIDDDGNSYLTGYFHGAATFGSYPLTSSGHQDIFVAKIDALGNWQWVIQAGGIYDDFGHAITIDDSRNSILTGYFGGTATFGSYSLTSSGYRDIFVAKMDADGNWLWATQAGGSDGDHGNGISTDVNGNSYVLGEFWDTAAFGPYSLTSIGHRDIFVSMINADGNWLWATQAGGFNNDNGHSITTDVAGNCYLTGFFNETATFGPYSLTSNGSCDIFVAKLGNDTSVENEIIPTKMELSNYPNPFNPSTTISFDLTAEIAKNAEIIIYNIKGQKVKQLLSDQLSAGEYSVVWDGRDDNNKSVSSGIYFYKLEVNGKTEAVRKCLLLK